MTPTTSEPSSQIFIPILPILKPMALETPKYVVIEKEAQFEIRAYTEYIIATVSLEGLDFEQASIQGFRIIADYIFGNNTKRDKVAMTAPVMQKQVSQSEKIAMTAPVGLSQTADKHYQISFVMPKSYTLETLPKPNNEAVSLKLMPASKMAVLSFSGKVNEARVSKMTQELQTWMDKKKLKAKGEVSLARYSPPYIPVFMQKNELAFNLEA